MRNRYWKQLGLSAMLIGISVLVYAVVCLIKEGDKPQMGLFVFVVGFPALVPAFLGYSMYRGSSIAAWSLRISIMLTLIIGGVLDVVVGLDVFSFAPVAVPVITGCILWLILSFV